MFGEFCMDFNISPYNNEFIVSIHKKSNKVSIEREIMPQHFQFVNITHSIFYRYNENQTFGGF